MSEVIDREFGWDDEIENDGPEYVLLPEGDYSFKVESFERGRHEGSEKLPPCPKAILKLRIFGGDLGETTIEHNLFLHSKCEGFLSAFFRSIGEKEHGEKLKMNWNNVYGATGKCNVYVDTYTKKDGTQGQSNKIKKFYDKEKGGQTTSGSGYVPGKF